MTGITDPRRVDEQLVGFYPRQVCDDITNNARDEIVTAIGGIDSWANSKVSDDDDEALQREINIVCVADWAAGQDTRGRVCADTRAYTPQSHCSKAGSIANSTSTRRTCYVIRSTSAATETTSWSVSFPGRGESLTAAVAGRLGLCERAARRGAPEGAGDAGPAVRGSAHKDGAGTLRRRQCACGTARRR